MKRYFLSLSFLFTGLAGPAAAADPPPPVGQTAEQLIRTWDVGSIRGEVTTTTRVVPLDRDYARAVVAALGGDRARMREDDRPVFNAEQPGLQVQEVRIQVVGSSIVAFPNLLFVLDKSDEFQDESSRLQLDEIARALVDPRLEKCDFLIEGHTCDLGEEPYNLELSKARAHFILESLVEKGVARERLVATGLGETERVAEGTDEASRAKNRRVVLSVIR